MKLSGFLFCSILLNGLLLVLLWNSAFKQCSHAVVLNEITNRTVRVLAPPPKQVESPAANSSESMEAFHWSQLESEDYRVYTANLRKLGCPEVTVRDIVIADVNELFYRHVSDLVSPVQNRFWELMANQKQFEQVVDEKWKELKELDSQRKLMLQELLGKFERTSGQQELANLDSREASRQLVDFLSPEKVAEYQKLTQRFAAARDELNSSQPPISQNDLQAKLKNLQEQLDHELAQLLSPNELAEYRLRKSGSAELRHKLAGFQATGEELRELARIEKDIDGSKERRERMAEFLGPDRFAQFERAQSSQYQEFYQVAERFDVPSQAIADAYEMRKAAEEQARELRADRNISSEDRLAALKAIHKETDRSLAEALGPEAFATYRSRSGQWLDGLESQR